MFLRSIELVLPEVEQASTFFTDIWGITLADVISNTHYLKGSGALPYLVALEKGDRSYVRSVTFVCKSEELAGIKQRVDEKKLPAKPEVSTDLGGGEGIIVELPEGELLRFLVDSNNHEESEGKDLPVKLSHVVFNSVDAEKTGLLLEDIFNFRVSDRTKGMVFVRCNNSHHSTAFARAGFSSLNHIAFEMEDMDAVMRGIGRLRDHGMSPAWGPGRHGPGDNVFAYYIAPFNAVVEFSTAVEKVTDSYPVGKPDDWTWPPKRIDQWGLSDKDFIGLKKAEEHFKFYREWTAQSLS